MRTANYSDLTKSRIYLSEIAPISTPFGVFIDLTNYCNFKCSFCPRNLSNFNDIAGPYQHMDMETYLKIVQDLKSFPKRIITIRLYYLGEPMLNRHFPEMLHILCRENICDRIEITTNGSLLTSAIAESILDSARLFSGSIYLRFSIYSVRQEHFQQVTRNQMNIEQIRNNIKTMFTIRNERGCKNVFLYAKKLTMFTAEDEEFLEQYKDIVDETALEEPMNWSGDGGGENFLLKAEYTEDALSQLPTRANYPKVCSYLFTNMAVMSDGVVVACCVDWSRKTQYGSVKENSLQEIWNGNALHQLRMMHLKGMRDQNDACANCKRMPLDERDSLDKNSEEIMNRLIQTHEWKMNDEDKQ